MILLTKNNVASPAAYSSDSGLVPITVAIELTGDGTPKTGSTIDPVYVWANNLNANSEPVVGQYTGINLSIVEGETGITWELSSDNLIWGDSISLSNITVSEGFQSVLVYARATAADNGSLATNKYTSAKVRVQAVENPE